MLLTSHIHQAHRAHLYPSHLYLIVLRWFHCTYHQSELFHTAYILPSDKLLTSHIHQAPHSHLYPSHLYLSSLRQFDCASHQSELFQTAILLPSDQLLTAQIHQAHHSHLHYRPRQCYHLHLNHLWYLSHLHWLNAWLTVHVRHRAQNAPAVSA